jgi:hypothetical protein
MLQRFMHDGGVKQAVFRSGGVASIRAIHMLARPGNTNGTCAKMSATRSRSLISICSLPLMFVDYEDYEDAEAEPGKLVGECTRTWVPLLEDRDSLLSTHCQIPAVP